LASVCTRPSARVVDAPPSPARAIELVRRYPALGLDGIVQHRHDLHDALRDAGDGLSAPHPQLPVGIVRLAGLVRLSAVLEHALHDGTAALRDPQLRADLCVQPADAAPEVLSSYQKVIRLGGRGGYHP